MFVFNITNSTLCTISFQNIKPKFALIISSNLNLTRFLFSFFLSTKLFFLNLNRFRPEPIEIQEKEFSTKEKRKKKSREVEVRTNNQSKFRFNVLKRYGAKCAICNIKNKHMLDAAHIVPVDEDGTDDPRNGLVLCKNHHAAFDRNLFKINPDDYSIDDMGNEISISESKL